MSDSTPHPARSDEAPTVPSKPASGKKRRRWAWVVVALVIILAVGGIFFLRHRGQSPSETQSTHGRGGSGSATIMVSTATAQKGDIGIYVNALGVVTPLNTVSVKSRVDGQLVKVNYQEGQLVQAGDPLVEIDPATVSGGGGPGRRQKKSGSGAIKSSAGRIETRSRPDRRQN